MLSGDVDFGVEPAARRTALLSCSGGRSRQAERRTAETWPLLWWWRGGRGFGREVCRRVGRRSPWSRSRSYGRSELSASTSGADASSCVELVLERYRAELERPRWGLQTVRRRNRPTAVRTQVGINPALLSNDPAYINRLRASGSPALVRAWLEGDWNVIEGAFFPEFDPNRHVITPFRMPLSWTRFRSIDWGSASPFSIGWWIVVQDDTIHDKRRLPKNSIVRYREWYGASSPNKGLRLPADAVAKEVVRRETDPKGFREPIAYGVMDPAAFAVVSGPSIGETFARHGVFFRRADNSRVSTPKRMGGWDQVRWRLRGDDQQDPMMFFVDHCKDAIRTLPMMQHDDNRPEDLDTEAEDHAVDDIRYACMSRPFGTRVEFDEDRNPLLVSNAFKLDAL